MSYDVIITREDDAWLADVPAVRGAHTFARSLPSLFDSVREVIVLMDDLPDDAKPEIVFKFDMRDQLIKHAAHVREARAELEKREAAILSETAEVVDSLTGAGYSMRDTAELVGLTPGRISQMTTAKNKSKARSKTKSNAKKIHA